MLKRARAMPSITLERSRPVLMTHLAPCRCRSPINACKSCGTGGFSKSAWSVPSKSVEISWIGRVIFKYEPAGTTTAGGVVLNTRESRGRKSPRLRGQHNPAIPAIVKTIMPTAQEQYDDAMFDFSQADYDSA